MSSPVKDTKTQHQGLGFTEVVERHKASLTSRNPSTGRIRCTSQLGGAGFHFGDGPYTEANEIDTAWVDADPILDAPWLKKMVLADYHVYFGPGTDAFNAGQTIKYVHPATGENVTFEIQQLQWTNDLDQLSPIADPTNNGPASIVDKNIQWDGAFGPGLDFKWMAHPSRFGKALFVDALSNIGAPPQFIIDGGNPVFRLPFIFQKSAGVDVWIDGVEWNENPVNPLTTAGHVEFRLASTGETLWYFNRPAVLDGSKLDPDVTPPPEILQRFRKTGPNLLVDVLVPWEWLETAVYPVIIDPTIDEQVGASGDDGSVWGTAGFENTYQYPTLGRISGKDYHVFLRFTGVTIDDTVDASYIELWLSVETGTATQNVYGVDEDNPAAPTSYATFDADPLTTAFVAWDDIAVVSDFDASPSLNTVFQELTDSYTISAEAVMVQLRTDAANNNDCQFYAYDNAGNPERCAKLHIESSSAGPGDYSVEPTDEAVTVGESVTVDPLILADVSEQEDVTVGDTPTLRLHLDLPSQQDDITVGDTATVDPVSPTEISETEPVTVGDTPTLDPLIIGGVSETEDVTVGDTATVDALLLEVSESDAVTTGETVTVDPVAPTEISELDAVTVGDTPTVVRPLEEDRNVSEQDDITVGDTPTVSLLDAETLSVSEQDDITVGDTPTVSVPEATALAVSETDPITVGDTATLAPVYSIDIDVSDGVTVTDTPTVQVPVEGEWYVSEGDAVTVGETVTLSPVSPTNVSELDAVTVGDTPTVFRVVEEAYFISESDGVTVVDTPTLGPVTPTEISEIDAITVVDTPTVTFFEPILTLSVGDAVSITDLSTVRFPSDMLGLDKPEKKPPQYLKDMLDMEPIVRPLSPTFALRQEQKSVIEANRVAEQLARQNEQAAADRVSAMLAREKVDKDKADRRRASSLHNLAKAQLAKEAKAAKQAEINKARKKNLQKARRKLKRQRKKK